MINFCPNNESLTNPWVNQGLHRCFVSTLSSILISVLFLIPGLIQFYVYYKYGQPISVRLRSKSTFAVIHLVSSVLVPLLAVSHILVTSFLRNNENIYGYMVFSFIVYCIAWPLATIILHFEFSKYLIRMNGRGHGFILLLFWAVSCIMSYLPLVSIRNDSWWWNLTKSENIVEFILWLLTTSCITLVFLLGVWAPGLPDIFAVYQHYQASGSTSTNNVDNSWARKYKHFKILYPFIWPHNQKKLQAKVFVSIILLLAGRVINIYSPILYKDIVNSLTESSNKTVHNYQPSYVFAKLFEKSSVLYRWDFVLLLALLRLLQGVGGLGAGLISSIRSQMWVAVDQYSTRELSVLLFSHIQSFSMDWHLSRKTGEMLRIVDRGTTSISNILNYFVFNILPTIIDIIIGSFYFILTFNIWYGLLIFITMIVYMVCTIFITEWRAKHRRQLIALDNQKNFKAVDALLNFETVKYFNAENFEKERFRQAFIDYQKADWLNNTSLNVLNTTQNVIINLGLLFGMLLCARDVVLNNLTVGDFVLFVTYVVQLYTPLSLFGTYYRLLQTSVIDMENMLELLHQEGEIKDVPNADTLHVSQGKIEFRDVNFGYQSEKLILRNISFVIPPGQTIALVGESGSGKSTIIRLLFRFYDVNDGQIFIDDQNISKVTQVSLRNAIGVVPQDTVLFNDTIRYNILYGRQGSSQSAIEDAAQSADIHHRILEFTDGYNTLVGERGLKLSGGEKQRVAIARNVLKSPPIVVLDEATSALDTATERNIQTSLNRIAQNRTTLVVAHRLSTVVNADQILVLHQGEIVERGRHAELIQNANSRYAQLWKQQSEAAPEN